MKSALAPGMGFSPGSFTQQVPPSPAQPQAQPPVQAAPAPQAQAPAPAPTPLRPSVITVIMRIEGMTISLAGMAIT